MSENKIIAEAIVPQLLPIEINSEARKNIMLVNTIKMLTERKLLDPEKLEQNCNHYKAQHADDLEWKIELLANNHLNAKHMIIKIINQKVTSISKSSLIADFLNKYKNDPKIVIVNNISDKFLFGIKHDSNYPNTELFLGKEMMMNIIDHIAVPKHILLSDDEMKLVLNSYHAKRREMPEILETDPIARYYNAKIGQMFRIIRASETTGNAPYYRLVIRGQIKSG